MRTVIVEEHGGPEVLEVGSRPEPAPGEGEIEIAVEAAGINFADIEKRRGDYPDKPDIHSPTPTYTPGAEAAGRVVDAGDGTRFSEGDDVMGFLLDSTYAEYAVGPADRMLRIPSGFDYAEAAGIPLQFLTAHNALYEWGNLEPEGTVLVHAGAGGVGSAAIQLADRIDATIYTTASTPRKLEYAADLGADRTVNYTDTSITTVAEDELDDGFDLVLDGVGGSAFKQSVPALAPGGRIVSYGLASGRSPVVAAPRLLFQNRSVVGYHLEHAFENLRERVLAARDELLELFEDGDLSVHVDRRFPLEEATAAHEYVQSRESIGKVVLEP